ncbi:MAG: aldo/keto reductase [Chloroflexi bacterium]|jgi:aryl-alcohol dehydrogenase-like predicted oxidoreductase|nr:aldo/keto reductase [Chloroflexota bacterium]
MKRVFLGPSGLAVSRLAMGTHTFGGGADERTAGAMADRFVEAGGNFFHPSSTYNGGASEYILGSWAKARNC